MYLFGHQQRQSQQLPPALHALGSTLQLPKQLHRLSKAKSCLFVLAEKYQHLNRLSTTNVDGRRTGNRVSPLSSFTFKMLYKHLGVAGGDTAVVSGWAGEARRLSGLLRICLSRWQFWPLPYVHIARSFPSPKKETLWKAHYSKRTIKHSAS